MSLVNGAMENIVTRRSTSSSSGGGSVFEERNDYMSLTSLNIVKRKDAKDDFNRAECIAKRLKKKSSYSDALCRQAIASTGVRDYRCAAKWLIDHVDDPLYGEDYYLNVSVLLIPSGGLSTIIKDFGSNVHKLCNSWRPSHNLPPRITLIKPFQIKCSKILDLYTAFENVFQYFGDHGFLKTIPLKFHHQENFLGFIIEPHTSIESILNDMINQFNKACYELQIKLDISRTVPFHMSLEYTRVDELSFSSVLMNALEKLRQSLPISEDGYLDYQETCWQLVLYTSDTRIGQMGREEDVEAYQMCTEWLDINLVNSKGCFPEHFSPLEYSVGDIICLQAPDSRSNHGYAQGFNCNTGVTGLFPLTCAKRVPVWKAWTQHRCLNMMGSPVMLRSSSLYLHGVSCDPINRRLVVPQILNGALPAVPSPRDGRDRNSSGGSSGSNGGGGRINRGTLGGLFGRDEARVARQLHVMRHGERADFALGCDWIAHCFDRNGVYKRNNLNLTSKLPSRPYEEFARDPPLTVIGHAVAAETGRALAEQGVQYSCCYCSPALRCVETAASLLLACGGANAQLAIRIEPFLFEWLGCYKSHPPVFMGPEHLRQCGYNVDHVYRPFHTEREFNYMETETACHERNYKITKRLLDLNKKRNPGNVLIVAHAGSLEACTRLLVSRGSGGGGIVGCVGGVSLRRSSACRNATIETKNGTTLHPRNYNVPYCSMMVAEERRNGKWTLVEPPAPIFSHDRNHEFDWRQLAAAM